MPQSASSHPENYLERLPEKDLEKISYYLAQSAATVEGLFQLPSQLDYVNSVLKKVTGTENYLLRDKSDSAEKKPRETWSLYKRNYYDATERGKVSNANMIALIKNYDEKNAASRSRIKEWQENAEPTKKWVRAQIQINSRARLSALIGLGLFVFSISRFMEPLDKLLTDAYRYCINNKIFEQLLIDVFSGKPRSTSFSQHKDENAIPDYGIVTSLMYVTVFVLFTYAMANTKTNNQAEQKLAKLTKEESDLLSQNATLERQLKLLKHVWCDGIVETPAVSNQKKPIYGRYWSSADRSKPQGGLNSDKSEGKAKSNTLTERSFAKP